MRDTAGSVPTVPPGFSPPETAAPESTLSEAIRPEPDPAAVARCTVPAGGVQVMSEDVFAHHRVVTEATVRTQVKSILAKLETSSQIGAVGVAHRVGWHRVAS